MNKPVTCLPLFSNGTLKISLQSLQAICLTIFIFSCSFSKVQGKMPLEKASLVGDDSFAITNVTFHAESYSSVATTNIKYVKPVASGTGDGSSWANASADLQAMIDASGTTEVWVAAGTYYPGVSRTDAYIMKNNVAIYGGFNGTETMLSQRNWSANTTVLSGDIGTPLDSTDNCYHVIFNSGNGLDSTAIIDGFTITRGNADAANGANSLGAGMYNDNSSPKVNNCFFIHNTSSYNGGGMYNQYATPRVNNCTFSYNINMGSGGGMYNYYSNAIVHNSTFDNNSGYTGNAVGNNWSNPYFENCTFSHNSGNAIRNHSSNAVFVSCLISNNTGSTVGGGMHNSSSNPYLQDVTFSNNEASEKGGGMYNLSSNPVLVNIIFTGNTAHDGGGMMNNSASPSFENCSFISNSAFSGGGMENNMTDFKVENCIFSNNIATGDGGGMSIRNGSMEVVNCVFLGNSATFGGGIANIDGANTISNCTFSGNVANFAGGIRNFFTTSIITNCILWGNSSELDNDNSNITVSYSIVQGGYTGTSNLGIDPLFVTQPPIGLGNFGDLHLTACSPGVNTGDNMGIPAGVIIDLDGNPRIYNNGTVDMGAYEIQSGPITTTKVYVNAAASGANNGSSWTDAFTNLQFALSCPSVTEIWVAAGTYYPGKSRTDAFVMKNNLAIYGGFNGTETMLSQRDWTSNTTILSGDIGIPLDTADNSYHVILNLNNGLDNSAIIDGLTITGGNANGSNLPNNFGGGMLNESAAPLVQNCIFSSNFAKGNGGGIFNSSANTTITNTIFDGNSAFFAGGGIANQNSTPTFDGCVFSNNNTIYGGGAMLNYFSNSIVINSNFINNQTETIGGGIYNVSSSPTFENCMFSNNSAIGSGGGMCNELSNIIINNCLFIANQASNTGGGIENYTSSPLITNCSFSGNSANDGGGISNVESSDPIITNSVFWGNSSEIFNDNSNPVVSYSIVQNGYTGTGNLSTDPLFINQPPIGLGNSGDLRLSPCSPGINTGDNASIPEGVIIDLDGNPRIYNSGIVDMGAYETQVDPPTKLYVNAAATGVNDGSSWANALIELPFALTCPNVTEVWVAAGTYYPGTSRTDAFVMKNNLAIYGGFIGTETALSERDWTTNATILSGDIGVPLDTADNSYHVILNLDNGLDSTAIIDGFTITGGNASENVSPDFAGGGMLNINASPTIINCKFSSNFGLQGGGMENFASNPSLVNCIFFSNEANSFGGGVFNDGCSPRIINCSFSGNFANSGGGIVNYQSSNPTIINSILWGNSSEIFNINSNPEVSHSIVQGGYAGTGNLATDPLFIHQPLIGLGASGDLHLQFSSPGVNAGHNDSIPAGVFTDLDGNPRIFNNGIVDMGAYELQRDSPPQIYVDNEATSGLNDGSDWDNAYISLQDALSAAIQNDTIFVAGGTYYPDMGIGYTNNDKGASFNMKPGVVIMGGFQGVHINAGPGVRNFDLYPSILSGDIAQTPSDVTDDSWSVIYNQSGLDRDDILDGFIITKGNGAARAGGMHNLQTHPTIKNCIFIDNIGDRGGAVHNSYSNARFENCAFINNTNPSSAVSGGAMASDYCTDLEIDGCQFINNTAIASGGALNNYNSVTSIINSSFISNTATSNGGAILNSGSVPSDMSIEFCSFSGNKAQNGSGQVYFGSHGELNLYASVLWGNNFTNSTNGLPIRLISSATGLVTHSIVEYTPSVTYPGTSNSNVDPLYFNAPSDLHLTAASPAKDYISSTNHPSFDMDGRVRPMGSGADLGAFEYGIGCANAYSYANGNSIGGTLYVNKQYHTDGLIESTQLVNSPISTIYSAGTSTELLPGFEVKPGAVFKAVIGGCN